MVAFRYAKKTNSITIEDEFEKARETFLKRNPDFTGKIEKN